MNKFLEERTLKRYLKRRVTFTLSLLVNFLITGGIYAQEEPLIKDEEKVLEEMFYKKSDERKTQIFFVGDHNHTNGSKDGDKSAFGDFFVKEEQINDKPAEKIPDKKPEENKPDNGFVDNIIKNHDLEIMDSFITELSLKDFDINSKLPNISTKEHLDNRNINNIKNENLSLKKIEKPDSFEITQINNPEPPKIEEISIPNIIIPDMKTYSSVNADEPWFWEAISQGSYKKGHNATISEVIMESGNWDINIAGSSALDGWSGEIANYTAKYASPYPKYAITNRTYQTNGIIGEGNAGIYRVIGSPYSSFEKETKVNIDAKNRVKDSQGEYVLRQFIHYDPHGDKAQKLEDIKELTAEERNEVQSLYDNYGLYGKSENAVSMILSLKGDIKLVGNSINIVGLQGHTKRTESLNPYLLNSGNISVEGNSNVIFAYTEATEFYGEKRDYFTTNYGDGNITIKDGTQNFIMLFNKDYANNQEDSHNFKNSGKISILDGIQNIGIYVKKEINNGTIDLQTPITILGGTQNIGFVHKLESEHPDRNLLNEKSNINLEILGGTNNVAIVNENTQKYGTHKIKIENSENSIGVVSSNGELNLNTGVLSITGDNKEAIGLLTSGGNIKSNGDIVVENGLENKVAIARDGNTIDLLGKINVNTRDSKIFYSEGENSSIIINVDNLDVNLTGESIGAFANKGDITILSSTKSKLKDTISNSSITIDNSKEAISKGVGLYAENGGKIHGKNLNLKVINGQAGVASVGVDSTIDLEGATIDYSGNGYAVYTNGGDVNLQNGTIILRGRGVGVEADLESKSTLVNLSGGKIVVTSNDAVATKLVNTNSDLYVSKLKSGIEGILNVVSIEGGIGVDGKICNSFKIAAIDGGNLNIDTDIEKNSNQPDEIGDFYYKRFLGQHLKLNLEAGKKVVANVLTTDADKYYSGQVSGLENSSSKLAKSNDETQINLGANSIVDVDRIDSGNGAIGAYIDFGKISLAKDSKIIVEKGDNIINSGGIGLYAVNGSSVVSNGNFEIYGNDATGIYSLTNRVASTGEVIENEFGSQAIGQGMATVINNGKINTFGDNSAGIFVENNGSNKDNSLAKVYNNGIINLLGESSIGIYGSNATITNENEILSGKQGIGIYGKDGSIIEKVGVIKVGDGGTALALDETSNLDKSITELSFTGINSEVQERKFGLFLQGETPNSAKEINFKLNGDSFENGVLLVANNIILQNKGELKPGESGMGIYGNEDIFNTGTITLSSNSQVGIVGVGKDNKIFNTGTINLLGNNGIGVIASNGANSVVNENIKIGGMKNIGYVAELGGKITIEDIVNFKSENSLGNIFVYGNGEGNIEVNSNFNVNGIANVKNGNAIGVYLNGKNSKNNLVFNENASLNVKNGGIGIYSIENNIISLNEVNSSEKGSVGIYTTGDLALNGKFNIENGAHGIYSSSGKLDLLNSNIYMNGSGEGSVGTILDRGASLVNGTVDYENTGNGLNLALAYMRTGDQIIKNEVDINLLGKNSIGLAITQGSNVKNKGNILVNNNMGLYVSEAGKNNLTNIGEILVDGGVGAFIEGANSSFDNNSGTIKVKSTKDLGLGVYLKNSSEKSIKLGNMEVEAGSVKVCTENSVVDFDLTGKESNIINLIAKENSRIKNNISVGKDSVGVYLVDNTNSFENTNISVEKSDGISSIGIYLKDGVDYNIDGVNIENNGGIGIYGKNSSIVYGSKSQIVLNGDKGVGIGIKESGTGINKGKIFVSGESVALLGKGPDVKVINEGDIIISKNGVGISARDGAIGINKGNIKVIDGVAMFTDKTSTVKNYGNIEIKNGYGMVGDGKIVNSGNIKVTGKGKEIYLTDSYISNGGKFSADRDIILDGTVIDITKENLAFDVKSISGKMKASSNFALIGNGVDYKVSEFMKNIIGVEPASDIKVETSPLFKSKIDETGNLLIKKVAYKDVVSGNEFDSLGEGLDSVLGQNNNQKDIETLKNLNVYLDSLSDIKFEKETERSLKEIRGDIYSNIQDRINDIENAFNLSFDEMNSSYNKTKDTDKYSVIYSGGHFKDSDINSNYDYDIKGLMYMRDIDGEVYGEKHGYSLGFAVSDFDFENSSSKEKVYSLKSGLHNVKPFMNNKVSLLTTFDITYNRHKSEREMLLDRKYKNVGRINSYKVDFENKLSKTIYRDLESEFSIYTALDFGYEKIGAFNESGTLALRVHDNDFFSTKGKVGLRGYKRFYVGNGIALKPLSTIEYSYEFGNVYSANEAKLRDSSMNYYDLPCPAKEKGVIKASLGLALEKVDHMGVTVQVEFENNENRHEDEVNYSLRFNYKF